MDAVNLAEDPTNSSQVPSKKTIYNMKHQLSIDENPSDQVSKLKMFTFILFRKL